MEDKTKVLNKSDLQSAMKIKGPFGSFLAGLIIKVLEIDEANRIQNKYKDYSGPDYSERVLEEVGVKYVIPEGQVDRIPAEGGFITISNHHFGAIDGLILSAVVGGKRRDYRILTNFLLSLIPGLKESFMPVNPISDVAKAKSLSGIRMALSHIANGGALGLFPAGEVATYQKKNQRTALGRKAKIEDKPWAENIIKIIAKSGLPVVPIYFEGTNSRNFHFLGKIHPRLRTIRLVHELFNKRGKTVQVRIGQAITAEEIKKFEDTVTLGRYLRSRVYALQADCLPAHHESAANIKMEPVAEPAAQQDVIREMESISDRILFENGGYRAYLTKIDQLPATLHELSRLREITFRAVGEGTGKPLDTDIYDNYFYHLILWHIENQEIAGSYRLGDGREIMERHGGIKGFYTASLFKFKPGAENILGRCMELGRTFIQEKYQREVLTFKLLLSGLGCAAGSMPHLDYYYGPVSISNAFPDFYRSLIIYFLEKMYPIADDERIASPTTPFTPDFLLVNPDDLLAGVKDLDDFNKLLGILSDGKFYIPVLVSKYFKCSAKLICCNIDPDFGNCLDGLILLRFTDYPKNTLRTLTKFMSPEWQERIYAQFGGAE